MRTRYSHTYSKHAILGAAAFALLSVAAGCGSDGVPPVGPGEGSTGNADLSSYVAIGNSITAGMQSAALSSETNAYAYPNLIAYQAGVPFVQPEIEYPGISVFAEDSLGILELPANFTSLLDLKGVPLSAEQVADLTGMITNYDYALPYNNLGVPSAMAAEIATARSSTEGTLSGSEYFDYVLRGKGTVLEQAMALNPTFVTVWLGNNDVLGYGRSGGTDSSLPVPVSQVTAALTAVLDSLRSVTPDIGIAIANIPNMLSAPYFTTVPPYFVDFGTGEPVLSNGAKQYYTGPDGQPLTDNDLVIIDAILPILQTGLTTLPDKWVLNAAEQQTITDAVDAYNAAIANLAQTYDCALVDTHALFEEMAADGISVGGAHLSTTFVTGGLFSLDALHPSSIGQTLIANEFIRAINEKFDASIPLASVAELLAPKP